MTMDDHFRRPAQSAGLRIFGIGIGIGIGRGRPGAAPLHTLRKPQTMQVRSVTRDDHHAWMPLWDDYNAFYGRRGETALAPEISRTTWERFLDPNEPVFATVAEQGDELIGMAHHLLHRSTSRLELTCYLQDLFTVPAARGRGVGKALIQGVYDQAKAAGVKRVYWSTHESNGSARLLYDKVADHLGFIVYSHDV